MPNSSGVDTYSLKVFPLREYISHNNHESGQLGIMTEQVIYLIMIFSAYRTHFSPKIWHGLAKIS
jgi:hypothetical protein